MSSFNALINPQSLPWQIVLRNIDTFNGYTAQRPPLLSVQASDSGRNLVKVTRPAYHEVE